MEALTTAQVCTRIGLSRCSIWRLIKAGQFPSARMLSPARRAWLSSDIDQWLQSRPVAAGPEPPQLRAARLAR